MALMLTTNAPNFPFHIVAKDSAGNAGAPLPADASLVTVAADKPEVVAISLDPNPTPVSNPFDPASGTRSVASGVARPLAAGTATVTATIVGTDGTPLATKTDTVTIVEPAEGTAAWAGTLFGATTPVDLPTPGAAASSATAPRAAAAASSAHASNPESHEYKKSHKA